jgi:hypothetical protein
MNIDHQSFKNKFHELLGDYFDIVSTIDHPYSSPPIRLVDGHNSLYELGNKGFKPLVCIWDVNYPNINNYKYELNFDTGIFGGKNKDFFIFSDNFLYPIQKPKQINFAELTKRVGLVLERLENPSVKTQSTKKESFLKNLDILVKIYKEVTDDSENGTVFYKNLMPRFYKLLGFNDLSKFISNHHFSYYDSILTKKWIPYCIEETMNHEFGFINLLNTGLFKKPCFRKLNIKHGPDLSNKIQIKQDLNEIIKMLRNNTIIPSYEVFFWTLFLADIKHFGNDYEFFERLKNITLSNNEIQLTRHNDDCRNLIQFESDKSFNCVFQNGNYIIRRNNPFKTSRISSLPALYFHLGKHLSDIIRDIFSKKTTSPKIIKMGEIPYI